MDSKVTLLIRHTSDQLSSMCREYESTQCGICPKGVFVCPFMHQDENGTWIKDMSCGDITPSHWDSILNPVEK